MTTEQLALPLPIFLLFILD